jgi:hypothetical protein
MRRNRCIAGLLGLAVVVAGMVSGCDQQVDLGPVANADNVKAIREAFASGAATAGETAQKAVGTGWATLGGQFVFDGDPPQMPPYDVTKEREFCTAGGVAPPQEFLVVDPGTKGIKNVVIFLRDASRIHDSAKPIIYFLVLDHLV